MRTPLPASSLSSPSMFDPRDIAGRMPFVLAWLSIAAIGAVAAAGSVWLAVSRRDAPRGWHTFVRVFVVAAVLLGLLDAGLHGLLESGGIRAVAMVIGSLLAIGLVRRPLPATRSGAILAAVALTLACGIACLQLRSATTPEFFEEPTLVPTTIEFEDAATGARAITDTGTTIRLGRFVVKELTRPIPDGFDGRVIVADASNSKANCHGWVFTGGEYRVSSEDVDAILRDNRYEKVVEPEATDLIVYRDEEGRVVHTGLVKAIGPGGFALIESKWGPLDIYWHTPDDQIYSSQYDYYRSPRDGHRLRIETPATEPAAAAAQP